MKFLLIYGVLFLLLWTKGSAIDREESLTDYTVEEGIVNESVLVEVPSSDLKTNYIPYFLYLKVLNRLLKSIYRPGVIKAGIFYLIKFCTVSRKFMCLCVCRCGMPPNG